MVTGSAATPTPRRGDAERLDPLRWKALLVALAANVMDLLDSTIVNVAMPTIEKDLDGTYASLQWIAAAYTLAFALGLVTGGRLGDIVGRKPMFIAGVTGFSMASLMCAMADSMEVLIAARALQGLLAAMMVPQAMGIMRASFPQSELAKATALFGPVMGGTAVLGPVLGGVLVDADLFGTGWRMIFLLNVPIGLLAVVGAMLWIRNSKAPQPPRLDLAGVVLLSVALLLLLYPLVQGRDLGWPVWTFVSMAASVPVVIVFGLWERHKRVAGSPLVEPSLFRKREFVAGLGVMVVFNSAMAGFFLIFTLYLQMGLGYSALHAGLTSLPWAIGTGAGSTIAAMTLAPKFGRRVIHVGAITMIAGMFAMILTLNAAGTDVSSWELAPSVLLSGFGMGLILAPLFNIVLAAVAPHEIGSASGTLSATQQLGSSVGIAVLGTIFFALLGGSALTAADKATPRLRAVMVAERVPGPVQDQVIRQFRTCAHDQAASNDPSHSPPACLRLARDMGAVVPNPESGQRIGQALRQAAADTRARDFTAAMKWTLVVIAGGFAFTFVLAFMLPRRARDETPV